MKKLFILITILLILLATTACQNRNQQNQTPPPPATQATPETFDIDALLDDYEEIVDLYIAIVNDVMTGSIDAIEQFETIQNRMIIWQQTMENIPEDQILPEHLQRLEIIAQKLDDALPEL